jgi:hypothetical protein
MQHWGRFSPSTPVSSASHSTSCFTLLIIQGWYNRPTNDLSNSGLHPKKGTEKKQNNAYKVLVGKLDRKRTLRRQMQV